MKAVFIILTVFLSITATAQQGSITIPVDENTGLITYKEVVNEPGTKDTLFNRAATWLHTFYSNPWDVTKVRDQSSGIIKIQHQFKIYNIDEQGKKTEAGMILYNAAIEFKDNRYRIVVDNFVDKELSRVPVEKWLNEKAPDYNIKWKSYLEQIDSYVRNELIQSLKDKMKPPRPIKKDDW